MSQTDKKRRRLASTIGESFAAIRRRTARSKAWLSLSAPAIKIYIELRLRWRHKHNNNGELFLSIAECKSLLGIPPGTAHRAFRELQEKGFLVMTRKGEAGKLNTAVLENGGYGYSRRATTWALTDEPYRGQPATHAYEQWKADTQKQIRASTGGTTTVPPLERKGAHGSTSGTSSGGHRPADSSASGTPVSTIYGARSDSLSEQRVKPQAAHPGGRASGWRRPRIAEIPRGPGTAKFGAWLKEQRELRGTSREFIAATLGVSVDGLAGMEVGRVQMPGPQRRRAEAALAKAELAKRAPQVQGKQHDTANEDHRQQPAPDRCCAGLGRPRLRG
jgi:hypothetical protein